LIWKFAESKKLGLNVCKKQETWSRNLLSWSDDGGGKTLGGLLGVQCITAAVRGDLSLFLSPTELVCDIESDHMTSVVAVFHTDCCCSSSSFADFNP
jgi:hypothetical protein